MARSTEERLDALEETTELLRVRLDALEARLAPAPPRPAPAAPRPRPARDSAWTKDLTGGVALEDLLGGRVLAWVGGIAVVLGIAFFLVMAVSRGWIDEATRVVLAALGSSALLALGLWLHERKGRTQAALAAVASAIAGLYATLTAATQLYHLVSPELGLGLAAVVGVAAATIAVRWEAQLVAAIGIVGALLAPVLVEAGTSDVALGFLALALASSTGVLVWRRWQWLGPAAFLVSAPQLLAWLEDTYAADVGLALAVLGGFWLLHLVAALGYELRVTEAGLRVSSAFLLFADVVLAAGAGYGMLADLGRTRAGDAWVLALAVAHVAIGAAGRTQRPTVGAGDLLVAVGIAVSGIAFALVLDGPALVVGWALEAVVLAWLGRALGDERAHVGAAAFLALALVHTLAFEAPLDALRVGVASLGDALAAVAAVAAASFAVAWLLPDAHTDGRRVLDALGAAALVYLGSVAIVETLGGDAVVGQTQGGQLALSAFWSLTGLAAVLWGLVADDRRFRLGGLSLLSLAVAKVFLYDLAQLESIYRVLSFIALGLLLLAGAYAYARMRSGGGDGATEASR